MPFHDHQLAHLTTTYQHIYLSPHLDDAALSCGGSIARFASAGAPVLVVNICSGTLPPNAHLSPFAHLLHDRWGLPAAEAVARRLHEDAVALQTLGADRIQLDLLDAIYRMPEHYGDDATLFGVVADDDPLAAQLSDYLAALAVRCPEAVFYAPLGVGHHVDHQAVHAAASTLYQHGARVAFYEDFPYVARAGALAQRLDELGGQALFTPVVTAIDDTLARKIGAIEAYASQLGVLFGDRLAMAQAVQAYAATVPPDTGTYGERIWTR